MSDQTLQPLLLFTSPLGDDTLPIEQSTLHAIALEATERLTHPFEVHLTTVSTQRVIDPKTLLYQPVCLTVRRLPQSDRFFNGIVRRVEAVGLARRDRWTYHLDIVPRLWFMSQAADCRVFQQKTVVQILQTLFSEEGVAPVEFRVYGEQPVRDYTTQFNETNLDFVHRLIQEAGYFYFFEHSKAAHTLVVSDRNQSFTLTDHPTHWVIHEGQNVDVFDRWNEAMQTAYGRVRLQDYDPTKPSTPVLGQQSTTLSTAGAASRDVFRWPAMTMENQVAADRARYRIEASEAEASLRTGHGFDPEFCPGRRFLLAKDPFSGTESIDHALYEVTHTATDDTWITGGGQPHYENSFTCLLQSVPWREAQTLPRPSMAGIFSAIVLGNSGEEIHADSIGRIKVRLLFDHRQETVASMAIWARVMQPWAGNSWGWQHLPRVGTEVAVSFMDGNPDAPVIVGSFYNDEMRPVFPIPEMQTRQGFRSRSTLRGSTQEFSELSFEDRKGDELVFLHAQKNYTTEVENDQSLSVTRSRTVTVGDSETVTVGQNHTLTSQLGSINVTADAGSVMITAATGITLRVAENSITLTPELIQVFADTLNLTAIAAVEIEAADVNITAVADVSIEAAEFVAIPPPDVPV
jgi:type VI secretion system secreted protein VgrG